MHVDTIFSSIPISKEKKFIGKLLVMLKLDPVGSFQILEHIQSGIE
jgi:hypothetical protein